jgi:hypothetical protein
LRALKAIHTVIYLMMVVAILYTLYAGITKTHSNLLDISLGLLTGEGTIFFGRGMRCPLTTLAKEYGDPTGYVGDILLPEWFTKFKFRFFGAILLMGLLLLTVNHWNLR